MTRLRWPALLAAAAFAWPAALLAGDVYGDKDGPKQEPMVLPKPADVQTFTVSPDKIALQNGDDAQQLIVTAGLAGGRLQDLTGDVQYTVADEKVAKITSAGRILPVGNGATTIQATYGDKTLTIPVTAVNCDVNLPINFGNQIVPIFTKLGCNSGGCHGKASGQNGFKISLLGFDPDLDYNAIVKEARGRRVFPAAPDGSLLLLKASGGIAHGGGKRMEVGSDEYRLIRRWIAAGTPFGKPTDPVVTTVSVFPDHRVLTRNNKQQFAVYAHYSDGSIEDVTRRAQYESNDQEIAVVDGAGLVRTLQMSGEAAIMVRYQVARLRLPRHGAARSAHPRLRLRAANRGGSVHVGQVEGTRPCALRFVYGRAVHPPRLARPDRHAADAGPGDAVHRRPGPEQARPADRRAGRFAGLQLLFRQPMGGHPARQAARPAGPRPRHLRVPRLDSGRDGDRQALRPVRPRDPRRQRRRGEQPADGLVQGIAGAAAVRGRHGPGVPRPASGVRPVPPPSLREVEPGRLLGHRGVLRPHRPAQDPGAGRVRPAAGGARRRLQPAARQRHQQANRPAGRDEAAGRPAGDGRPRRRPAPKAGRTG